MYVPMYNGKTFTPIYIPSHHSYSTSTGNVREICDTECNTGDYLLIGWVIFLFVGVLVVFYYITKDVFK